MSEELKTLDDTITKPIPDRYIQLRGTITRTQITTRGKRLIISILDQKLHKWNTQTLDERQVEALINFLNQRKQENENH